MRRGDADDEESAAANTELNVTPNSEQRPGIDSVADTAVASQSEIIEALEASGSPGTPSGSTTIPDVNDLVGVVLQDRYSIGRKVGQGGMGAVYEATHLKLEKRVAVKVLLEKYAQKDKIVARLEQEAKLASSIGHKNIIDITDFGTTVDGRTFVVMEFLKGESVGQRISRIGPLDPQRAIHIARQTASALGAAHAKGIIHRDIKPENVFLLDRDGEKDFVKVVDFGISKSLTGNPDESPRLTQTGMVLGTPLYMSPEQARGDEDLDRRIDIYALGVLLYEMVTGEVPFRGGNYLNILSQVMSVDPPLPSALRKDLDPEIEAVILKAMSKERDERYATMEEFGDDLETLELGDDKTTAARLRAARIRRGKMRRSLRVLWWMAGVLVVIGGVTLTVSMVMSDGEQKKVAAALPVTFDAEPPRPPADAAPIKKLFETYTIHFKSVTEGAQKIDILRGGIFEGTTPLKVKVTTQFKEIQFIARAAGFDEDELIITPSTLHDGKVIRVRLTKTPKGRKAVRKMPKKLPSTADDEQEASNKRDDTVGGELTGNPFKK